MTVQLCEKKIICQSKEESKKVETALNKAKRRTAPSRIKQRLDKAQTRSKVFQSSKGQVYLELEVDVISDLRLRIEHSEDGLKFKNFFNGESLTITDSAKYEFKLTGEVSFIRIDWRSGIGEIKLTFHI